MPVQALSAGDVEAACGASVAAFASPSAVKSWLALVGGQATADVAIACIGAYTSSSGSAFAYMQQHALSGTVEHDVPLALLLTE